MERVAFFGCSRGLGRAVYCRMRAENFVDFSLLVSRNEKKLKALALKMSGENQVVQADFSRQSDGAFLVELVKKQKIKRLFYFAGGGPYGPFTDKEWKDHRWALQVSLLTPAFLVHQLFNETHLEQMVFVGSLVADDKPDPLAASYACAKHGLRGLVTTLIQEPHQKDLRFFRPGYMDTDMLPPKASVRQKEGRLLDCDEVACTFFHWVKDPKASPIFSMDNPS